MKKIRVLITIGIALWCLPSAAQTTSSFFQPKFQYAAKFVCGVNPGEPHGPKDMEVVERPHMGVSKIVPGVYATAINILNPSPHRTKYTVYVSPSHPEDRGVSEPYGPVLLNSLYTYEVDCPFIRRYFRETDDGCEWDESTQDWSGDNCVEVDHKKRPPFTKGFVVIKSAKPLDVVGVYTQAGFPPPPPPMKPMCQRTADGYLPPECCDVNSTGDTALPPECCDANPTGDTVLPPECCEPGTATCPADTPPPPKNGGMRPAVAGSIDIEHIKERRLY